jgi:Tol biopolymer transport system component
MAVGKPVLVVAVADAPIWAPNGRFVMYTSTQGSSRQRYMMREDGQANYLLPAMAQLV